MNTHLLKEVKTKEDEVAFLNMTTDIYKDDANWVRPLDNDIKNTFNHNKNLLFNEGEAIRWILIDETNKIIGRIAAFYNGKLLNKSYCRAGGCGFFECIDSQEAANMLFDESVEWLSERGIQAMDGSINFGERDQFWGVLVDGFHHPMYGSNYNRPYYGKLFENYGFNVFFNQYSYYRELSSKSVNPAVIEKARRLSENTNYEFRSIRKNEMSKVATMFRRVYNKAWSKYEDISKMSQEQADKLFSTLKPIIDRRVLIFAFYQNEPIGFFIMIPDINMAIKSLNGNIEGINLLKFLYKLKVKKSCNILQGIVFGVDPEFQGKGIESGMIMALCDLAESHMIDEYKHLEITWIGDFNPLMMRVIESYVCATRHKHYITYRYMIDKSIEFKRAERVSVSRK